MTNVSFIKSKLSLPILTLLMLVIPWGANASTGATNIHVNVTVTADVCTINNNQPVKAEFGDVQITSLSAAKTSFQVFIACDSSPSGTVQLAINGTGSSFDGNALETDIPGLGVIVVNPLTSSNLHLNSFYDVQKEFGLDAKTGTITLNAGLESDGKTVLSGGEFKASATLVLQIS